jgi:UDP-2,4-diacetamido-2,4,6-trideoxy-beta-L-altropyranose hydrolase
VDSSATIGAGHVMRCLALANALSEAGNNVRFICKEHASNLIDKIIGLGYQVARLSLGEHRGSYSSLAHAEWLGGTQEDDAEKTIFTIKSFRPELIVVDHYAIDERWHKRMRPYVKRIFVIDDLADRRHDCDILLDQNLGSSKSKYSDLVPNGCMLLLEPKYALLRPEFAEWRDKSLQRRNQATTPKNILVSIGGYDLHNITSEVVNKLSDLPLFNDKAVNVVLGSQSPHIGSVKSAVKKSSQNTTLHVDCNNMAELMCQADLAIGASGSTSWERCSIGVPTIQFVTAKNQLKIANELEKAKAAITASDPSVLLSKVTDCNLNLAQMSKNASMICDGLGTVRIAEVIRTQNENCNTYLPESMV